MALLRTFELARKNKWLQLFWLAILCLNVRMMLKRGLDRVQVRRVSPVEVAEALEFGASCRFLGFWPRLLAASSFAGCSGGLDCVGP